MHAGSVDPNQPQVTQFPVQVHSTAAGYYMSGAVSPTPILKANSVLPAWRNRSPSSEDIFKPVITNQHRENMLPESMTPSSPLFEGTANGTTRISDVSNIAPSSPSKPAANGTPATSTPRFSSVLARSNSSPIASLQPTPTGTRYGAALGSSGSPVKVFSTGATPVCPRCEKNVYFAEQVSLIRA